LVTPWVCAYCPVSRLARLGAQSGVVEKTFVSSRPLAASSARVRGMTSAPFNECWGPVASQR
jgi:hypothetical protein